MTRHNKAIAFDLLEEMISSHEEMSSERRLGTIGLQEGEEYYEQVRKDYEDAMTQYFKLKKEVLALMMKGLGE